MTKIAKTVVAAILFACAGCVVVFAEDANAPAVMKHRFMEPSMYISTNVWETIKGKAQPKLTAGENITISEDNVISATGGGGSDIDYAEVTNISVFVTARDAVKKATNERVQAMTLDGGAFIGDSEGHIVVQSYAHQNYFGSSSDDLYLYGKHIYLGAAHRTLDDFVEAQNGSAENLTLKGETIFASSFVEGENGGISYKVGDVEGNWCDWYFGTAGFWAGACRFRKPADGVTETLAFLSDIPETAGIDITVLTVTNTEDRISFPSPDAKSIVGRANLISTDTKMMVTNSLLTIIKNGIVLWQEEDDGYYMFDKMTNLNHSVVTITSDFEHSSWDTVIPNAEEGELRDWIVTIFASEETSSTLSFGKFEEQGYALWASDGVLDAEDPSISTVEQGKAAMFYFTEIKAGLFVVGKANLSNAITPAPASEVQ